MNGGSTATFESTNTFSSGVTATSGTDTFGMDSNLARRLSKPQQLVSMLYSKFLLYVVKLLNKMIMALKEIIALCVCITFNLCGQSIEIKIIK